MFFLPITLDVLSAWRWRAGGLNPQERRILRDTFFTSDEKARLSRAYHRAVEALSIEDENIRLAMLRKLVDLGEEGICDEDLLYRCLTENVTRAVHRNTPRLGATRHEAGFSHNLRSDPH